MLTIPTFFADDTALLIFGKSFRSVQRPANAELAKVSNWIMTNNLIINTTKTVALFISLNLRKSLTDLFLTFNNETVYPSNTAKYLGELLDNELFLKSHIISQRNCSFHSYYCKS